MGVAREAIKLQVLHLQPHPLQPVVRPGNLCSAVVKRNDGQQSSHNDAERGRGNEYQRSRGQGENKSPRDSRDLDKAGSGESHYNTLSDSLAAYV